MDVIDFLLCSERVGVVSVLGRVKETVLVPGEGRCSLGTTMGCRTVDRGAEEGAMREETGGGEVMGEGPLRTRLAGYKESGDKERGE